eukprot:gene995-310_t
MGATMYNVLKTKVFMMLRTILVVMKVKMSVFKEDSGSIYMTMDACIRLVRKKSASKYVLPCRHADLYFLDQDNVDHFDCSDFNAGSTASENLVRNKLFDIKAVFGSVCRHEFPLKFLNLKHGERIAYPVMLIKEQLEGILMKPDLQLYVSYDIACILKGHLESSKQVSLLNKISLALPSFHTYAHRPSCQIALGAKYCEKFDLTEGEQCERLWSYLRCFSAITKEMRAANRKDLLTDTLLLPNSVLQNYKPLFNCKERTSMDTVPVQLVQRLSDCQN